MEPSVCHNLETSAMNPCMPECIACGDIIDDLSDRAAALQRIGRQFYDDELAYCRECADEKFRKAISQPTISEARLNAPTYRVIRATDTFGG